MTNWDQLDAFGDVVASGQRRRLAEQQRKESEALRTLLEKQARERKGVCPCPHCGGGIPQIGVKICMHCRHELHWANNCCGVTPEEAKRLAREAAKSDAEYEARKATRAARRNEESAQADSRTLWRVAMFCFCVFAGLIAISNFRLVLASLFWVCVAIGFLICGWLLASRRLKARPSAQPSPSIANHWLRLPNGEIRGPCHRQDIVAAAAKGAYADGTKLGTSKAGPWKSIPRSK
jgi:hypothetical protein